MNSGDLNKVWEIKTLKRKPKEEEARKILDRIAKQVQPIMRNHNWRVKVLSEFWYDVFMSTTVMMCSSNFVFFLDVLCLWLFF